MHYCSFKEKPMTTPLYLYEGKPSLRKKTKTFLWCHAVEGGYSTNYPGGSVLHATSRVYLSNRFFASMGTFGSNPSENTNAWHLIAGSRLSFIAMANNFRRLSSVLNCASKRVKFLHINLTHSFTSCQQRIRHESMTAETLQRQALFVTYEFRKLHGRHITLCESLRKEEVWAYEVGYAAELLVGQLNS